MRIRHETRALLVLALCLASSHGTRAGEPAPVPAHRVLVVVFDGMRPDFISEETTPHLWRLASEGVFFAHHHPVYLSSTEVNGTAIATGRGRLPFTFDTGAAALALGLALLLNFVFASWPALRAARLDPVMALRHE